MASFALDQKVTKTDARDKDFTPLVQLAHLYNISTSYLDAANEYHEIDDDVLIKILNAMHVSVSSDQAIEQEIDRVNQNKKDDILPNTIAGIVGQKRILKLDLNENESVCSVKLFINEGECLNGGDLTDSKLADLNQIYNSSEVQNSLYEIEDMSTLVLSDEIDSGYHLLQIETSSGRVRLSTLVYAPQRQKIPQKQSYGFMSQFYSQRSRGSWGIGDFEDLKYIATASATNCGADFLLINPVHGDFPSSNQTPSPYFPVSKAVYNPIYIRPEKVAEYINAPSDIIDQIDNIRKKTEDYNNSDDGIDRNSIWKIKKEALWILHNFFCEKNPLSYDEIMSSSYINWAKWCCQYEGIETIEKNLHFYIWLQEICELQLKDAQKSMIDAGAKIGLISDMAVGVQPDMADAKIYHQAYIDSVNIGAPPDIYNQLGQDWNLPPLNPLNMDRHGYKLFRLYLQKAFQVSGAIRIDHALGLFRLWWIPKGEKACHGAYVVYNHDILINILILEAMRYDALIIGEDLGTVPEGTFQYLKARAILGTSVLWFERESYEKNVKIRAKKPEDFRELCFSTVHTHDIPPSLGYINGEHVKLREKFNLLTQSYDIVKQAQLDDLKVETDLLIKYNLLAPEDVNDEKKISFALQALLFKTPSILVAFSFADFVGERITQNIPGTDKEYPNWQILLADSDGKLVYNEDLFTHPYFVESCKVFKNGKFKV